MNIRKTTFYSATLIAMLLVLVAWGAGVAKAGHNVEGLVGYWSGNGTSEDFSGHGNHGILTGGAGFSSGQVRQAFSLDGVDDQIRISGSGDLDVADEITISAWVLPTSPITPSGGAGPIVEYNDGIHFWTFPDQSTLYANLIDESGRGHVVQTAPGVLPLN